MAGIRRAGLCALQAVLLAFCAPGFAHPQSCIDYESYFHWISSADIPSPTWYASSLAVAGNLLCIMDQYGLVVNDVTDPKAPRYVGRNNMGPGIMTAAGSFAYVVSEPARTVLSVIDLANPSAPAIRGSAQLPEECTALAILGSHLFAACGSTLQSIDVTDPSRPTIAGFGNTLGRTTDITARDSLAFLTHANIFPWRLEVIDISDPLHPQRIGRFANAPPTDIEVLGNYVYMLTSIGLHVIDVSDPRAPFLATHLGVEAWRLAVAGDTAYLISYQGVILVDIENPAQPHVIGRAGVIGPATHIVAAGRNLYVAVSESFPRSVFGIEIFDIASRRLPPVVARIPGPAYSVSTAGDLLFCRLGGSLPYARVSLFDITDASVPQALGTIDLPTYPSAVAMIGNVACFADGPAGIQLNDLTNRDAPRYLKRIATPGEASDVAALGTHAYVTDTASGVWIVDVSDPGDVRVDTIIAVPSAAIEIAQNRAYVGGPNDVLVLNLANPVAPTVMGRVPVGGPFAVSETMLASANEAGWVSLFDVSEPGAPAFLGQVRTPHPEIPYVTLIPRIAMTSRHVYVSGFEVGMHVVDISDPRSPMVVGEFGPPESHDSFYGIAIAGEHVFLAERDGVTIVPAACGTATPVLLHDLEAEAIADGVRLHWMGDTTGRALFEIRRARGSQPDDGEYRTLDNVEISSDGPIHEALDRDVEPATTYSYRIAAQFASGEHAEIGPVIVTTRELHFGLRLLGPSPMRDHTSLGLELPRAMPIDLGLYDVAGRLVRRLACCGTLPAGRHVVTWDGHDTNGRRVASGVYLAALQSGKNVTIQRIAVMR